MGAQFSSTAKSTHPEDVKKRQFYIPFTEGSEHQRSSMSLTLDAQVQLGDDFGQDTLMGLQELDSQLAIFEESADLSHGVSATSTSDPTSDITPSAGDIKSMAHIEENNITRTFPNSDNATLPSSTGTWSLQANGRLMYVLAPLLSECKDLGR
jgi:hypothetical protein